MVRAIQGGFGALLIPQGFGMIKQVFADDEIQKAFAAFGPVIGLSAVASPIIGGALTSGDLFGLGWRAIFLVNVPLGIVGLIGSLRVLPKSQPVPGTRLDPVGVIIARPDGKPYYANAEGMRLLVQDINPSAEVLEGAKAYKAYVAREPVQLRGRLEPIRVYGLSVDAAATTSAAR